MKNHGRNGHIKVLILVAGLLLVHGGLPGLTTLLAVDWSFRPAMTSDQKAPDKNHIKHLKHGFIIRF